MKIAKPGSISEGTLHPEHLMPDFAHQLRMLDYKQSHLDDIEKRLEKEEQEHEEGHVPCYWGSEQMSLDLETLMAMLEECTPPYMYFGVAEGNSSDFGFWLSSDWQEFFDGLQVGDLSEVPEDYEGEVAHINDHGNVTLYACKKGTELTEIWSIV